ncbi:MAG: bifunctional [glutamate--ammonia ligase]-adenylyl-L-tyrosine [Nevskia sp.]|nr:bifunctional [glutamate--ammonia ligase]-adenylyl-L-tyrosine [Nevskia sp.]
MAAVDSGAKLGARLSSRPPGLLNELPAVIANAHVPVIRRVLDASPFVAQVFAQQSDWAASMLAGAAFAAAEHGNAAQRIAAVLAHHSDEAAWMRELRRLRNREFARIACRDIAGYAPLDETLQSLSTFADAAVASATACAYARLAQQFGTPRTGDGSAAQTIVLGMGKLGGSELNFSSDIDLIFAYTGSGDTDGARALSNEEFFVRLVQQVVKLLAQRTPDGFVFRVDTMLRPFGSAGAPALPVDAMENYYQSHGREWERYALIKARPIAGDLAAGHALLTELRPFIYRRYLDFNALGSLRDLKQRIDQAAAVRGAAEDLKLGPGGIRELEFIVQLFQLTRGGQDARLRDPRLRTVLRRLAPGQLPQTTVDKLDEAYVFLRRCENAVQMYADEQTHKLPQTEAARQALCSALDESSWSALMLRLNQHRDFVRAEFERLFAEAAPAVVTPHTLEQLWDVEPVELDTRLQELGFTRKPQELAQAFEALRQSSLVRRLDELAHQRLRTVMNRLAQEALQQEDPDTALLRTLQVVGALAGRGTYLALLRDSATARAQLVRLSAASPWIADLLSQTPALLDTLLDARLATEAPQRAELQDTLTARAAGIGSDIEEQMDLLRRYRQEMTLRIAAADLAGSLPLVKVSDRLTWLAEAIVAQALGFARTQLETQFGPRLREDGSPAAFAVIAYGKFGSIELGYGSDLDLVFVYDTDAPDAPEDGDGLSAMDFFARVAQRTVRLLSALTGAGRAYEIDLQLRPSGNSGLVVVGRSGFARYQRESAWTWEHQALLKARPVAGDAALCDAIAAIRSEVLSRPRDAEKLRHEVRDMRAKMRASLEKKVLGRWDVKQGSGGLVDAEFITQYLCLRDASAFPQLLTYTDNWRQLEALAASGRIGEADMASMLAAERAYRGFLHRRALQQQDGTADQAQFADERAAIAALWQSWLEKE